MNQLLFLALNTDIYPANHPSGMRGLLIAFIIGVLVIAIVGGLIWMIDRYVHQIPDPVKLVAAIILVALVLIWACSAFF